MDPQLDTPTPPTAPAAAAAATPRRGGADGGRRAGTGPSLPEVHRSVAVPRTGRTWFGFARKLLAFSGPGYLVAVGYMDPGNWATDLAGGSQFGYALLSVVIVSSLMAIVLQHLAVRLGVATGRDLAQACRDHFSPAVSFALWVGAEVAIAACDLAEVIGSAIALNLLFHLPLIWGVGLTAADVLAVLFLQGRSFRLVELLVLALIGVIAVCFGVQIFWSRPEWAALAAGCLPSAQIVRDPAMLYVAVGILGATVMPHNLYLHSSLTQTRHYDLTPAGRREALFFGTLDATLALSFALFVNAAILVLAAATFHHRGHPEVAEIQDAFRLLSPLLGAGAASTLFAVALLASGQNSTLTGTLAGQVVMEGFLHLRLPPVARRLVTRLLAIVPALVVTAVAGEHGTARLLVLSQVILSLQLPFAVVPLVWFTGQRAKMGALVAPRWLQATGWGLAALIVVLNAWLLLAPGLRGTTSGP